MFLSLFDRDISGLGQLWYVTFGQICDFPEFRQKLEKSPGSIQSIKKVIRTSELAYAEFVVSALRNLLTSAFLLQQICDPITVPHIFRLFLKASSQKDNNSGVQHATL